MKTDLFKGLNPQQRKAATFTSGSSVILAGAGSGKTRVLVYKVLYLIEEEKTDPGNILMITFTNKAAGEMKKRIKKVNKYDLGFIGTFHSFCATVLRNSGKSVGVPRDYVIYDDDDQSELLKQIMKEKNVKTLTPSFVQNRISAAKNQLITPGSYLEHFSDYTAPQMYDIYLEYEKSLQKNHALDFDDLILKTVILFRKDRDVLADYQKHYVHIFVDEFQDTNFAQYNLTKLLGKKNNRVTVVGDFSQSIYSWRGADIRNLEKFRVDFPGSKIFYLEENYRSTQKILDFAYRVIEDNEGHPILKLFTNNTEGEEVVIYEARNEEDEAFFVSSEIERLKEQYSFQSMAVLYRTNAQSRAIEESFLHYGIPYMLIGGTRFYERKEIKDVLSYVRLIYNPLDELSKDRVKKLGKRRWELFRDGFQEIRNEADKKSTSEIIEQIFSTTGYLDMYRSDDEDDYSRLENIKELKSVADHFPSLDAFLQQVALVESEYSAEEKKMRKNEGVRLMTLHQAKGLEFKVVFITGVEDGILPHVRAIDDYFQLEEERRLFYVGITRAEKRLFITYAKKRFLYGRRGDTAKSRFLGGTTDEWY